VLSESGPRYGGETYKIGGHMRGIRSSTFLCVCFEGSWYPVGRGVNHVIVILIAFVRFVKPGHGSIIAI